MGLKSSDLLAKKPAQWGPRVCVLGAEKRVKEQQPRLGTGLCSLDALLRHHCLRGEVEKTGWPIGAGSYVLQASSMEKLCWLTSGGKGGTLQESGERAN